MPFNVTQRIRVVAGCALVWAILVAPAAAQRISAELDASRVTVANDLADATFKVVVHNEEAVPISNVWLVFEDGFDVAVGDVDAESSHASEDNSRTFDLSGEGGTAHVPVRATLKYSVDGKPVEQAVKVLLRLEQ